MGALGQDKRTKENYNSILRGCLHRGRGSQVGNQLRWDNLPVHIISNLNLITFLS